VTLQLVTGEDEDVLLTSCSSYPNTIQTLVSSMSLLSNMPVTTIIQGSGCIMFTFLFIR